MNPSPIVLSAIMSTVDSLLILASSVVVRDVVQFVACKLLEHETVEGQIRVECPDDIVAISPGFRFLAVAFVAVGLAETDDIHPMPSPPFAELRSREQVIDGAKQDEDYSGFNPKVGLVYDTSDDSQLFTNISRSFEPPTTGNITNTSQGDLDVGCQGPYT